MKNIDEIDDNINELIMQKSFSQLTADEKKKAMEYAGSEDEYNTLRSTLLAITNSFGAEEEMVADAGLKNDLMSQFEKKFGKENGRIKIIPFYRKPIFQLAAAASIALLIFFSFPLFNSNENKQGQLAMNDISKEAPAKDISGESTETTAAVTMESNEKSNGEMRSENGKVLDGKEVITEAPKAEETTLGANSITALDQENKPDAFKADMDDKAAEDLKTTNKNLAFSKTAPSKKEDDNMFLLEEVNKKHRDKDSERKTKKEKEGDRLDDLAKSETKKVTETDVNMNDQIVNAATGSAYNPVPCEPGRVTATITTNHFMEENNSAMIDLLFTAF